MKDIGESKEEEVRSKRKRLRVEIQREDNDIDMDRKIRKSKDAGMQALEKVFRHMITLTMERGNITTMPSL